ncbi:MAG: C4-dicarboxylate TRAP transporter substrate-binding protein [Desulfitobacterium hafniense]|nr:C4-dicarboxylate TRAP transporter substrate-binding protein [Desulfitobacterium hafniense]
MKKKFITGIISASLIFTFTLAGCGSNNTSSGSNSSTPAQSDKKVVIKVGYENNPGEPIDQAMKKMADLVKEKSKGTMELQLFPSSQLGSKKDITQQMLMGTNVMTITDASFLADYVPDIGILSGPYLGKSYEDMIKLTQTDWWKGLEKQLADKGLHIVATNWHYGDRSILSKKAITKPEELKGMKIRVPDAKLMIESLKAMGATSTPMPLGDVYTSLTQGVIDGVENPLAVLYGGKFHEAVKYLSLTKHMNMLTQWIVGQKFYSTLTPDQQKILDSAGNEAGLYMNQIGAEADQKALDAMKAAGVKVNEVDMGAFREAVKPLYKNYPGWTPGLYDKLQDLLKK